MRVGFRLRFALAFSGLAAILISGFVGWKVVSADREARRDLRSGMEDDCALLTSLLEEEVEERGGMDAARTDMERILRGADYPIRIDFPGGVLAESDAASRLPRDAGFVTEALSAGERAWTAPDGDELTVVARRFSFDGGRWTGTVLAGRSTHLLRKRFDRSLRDAAIVWGAAVLLSLVAGRFLAGRALAPVRDLTRVMEVLRAVELAARGGGPATDDPELSGLVEAFHRMRDRLSAAFGRLDRYVADTAHEVQTPLAVMRGHLEVALREGGGPPEERELLATLLDEVESMQRLAADLLYLARADAGGCPPSGPARPEAEVDLAEVARDAQEIGALLGTPRRVSVRLTRSEGEMRVRGDRSQLMRAVTNVVDNAVKYAREGGVVEVRLGRGDRGARMEVEDDGAGIAAADLPHVFERFYKADASRSRATRGTGLGLSVAQAIVQSHGGAIAIRSGPGRGTTVTIDLPLADDAGLPGTEGTPGPAAPHE